MGSNLMGSRDFIKFIQAAGKGARKRSNKTLAEAETAMSQLWGRRNQALCAPEPMQNLKHPGNICPKRLRPPLQVKLASIRVWKYIYRTGYSFTIFLLIINRVWFSRGSQWASIVWTLTSALLVRLPHVALSLVLFCGDAAIFPCHQNYIWDDLHLLLYTVWWVMGIIRGFLSWCEILLQWWNWPVCINQL